MHRIITIVLCGLMLVISGCAVTNKTNSPEAAEITGRCLALRSDSLVYYQWYPREPTRIGELVYYIYLPGSGNDAACSPPTVAAYLNNPEGYKDGPGIKDWRTTRLNPGRCTREYLGVVKKGTEVKVTKIHKVFNVKRGAQWHAFGKIISHKWGDKTLILQDWLRINQENGTQVLTIDGDLVVECGEITPKQPIKPTR